MAQATDYTIANSTGANVRADINTVLEAIATNNSGSSAPSNTQPTQFFADTSAGILKLRNTANSGYVNLFTLAGGVDVDAASNFNEDVTFTTANGNNIVFDKSDQSLEFGDDTFAKFGAGGDLSITHTGSRSEIHSITGDLIIRSDSLKVNNAGNSEEMARFTANGAAELYFDNSKKFETTSTGVTVLGTLTSTSHFNVGDNVQIQLGNAANNDFILVHDGTDNIINCGNNGNLFLRSASTHLQSLTGENKVVAEANGAVELYHDNVKSIETTATGCTIQKDGSNINAQLFIKATNGGQAQLQLEAGGNQGGGVSRAARIDFVNTEVGTTPLWTIINDYNQNGTNDLSIRHGAEESITANMDSAVELFFDNSKKLTTQSSGAKVLSTLQVGDDGGSIVIANGSGFSPTFTENAGDLEYKSNNSKRFTFTHGGDINIEDNRKLAFGGSNQDLRLFHDGTDSFIINSTGDFEIRGAGAGVGNVLLRPKSGENGIIVKPDDNVQLYFDNSKKLFTHSLGVTVESTGNTPTIVFRGASNLDMGNIAVDQFTTNFSLMKFFTLSSGTQNEVCRLLDNGQILIGKTTNAFATGAGIIISANGNVMYSATGTAAHDFGEFHRGTNGSMTRVGFIRTTSSGTQYSTTSDYRLKENATAISDGITRLKTLKPYRFNFKSDSSTVVDGFFAHEVTAVPEAVSGIKDEVDSDNNPVYQGIDQSKLVPLLVAAVQELITKVETLEAA